MLAACCAFIILHGSTSWDSLRPRQLSLNPLKMQSVNVYLWCLFGSHKLVLYQQQLEKKTQKSLLQPIGPFFQLCCAQQVAVDQANEPSWFKSWVVNVVLCCFIGFRIPSFSVGPRLKGWKIIKVEKRGVIQKVVQSKLQHFAEISRNSVKFLCFFCWPLAVPSKQLYIGHVLTDSMWGGGGIKEPRQRQGLVNHGKCWSIKLRRVYHVISSGFLDVLIQI